MSLLNPANPIKICSRCGRRFLASPDPIGGMEFDDDMLALKRHAHVVLQDKQQVSLPVASRQRLDELV